MKKTEITLTFHLHGPLRKLGEKILMQLPYGISAKETLTHFFSHYATLASWQTSTRCAMELEYLLPSFKFIKNLEIHLIPPVSGG